MPNDLANGSSKASGKKRVLAIDDEEIILEIIVAFLEEDFDVTTFENPVEAIKEIEKTSYDLVLTDFSMVTKTAIDIIEAVKKHQSEVPIIVMTGDDKEGAEANKCRECGASEILEKPFRDSAEIIETIEHCIQKAQEAA